VTQRTRLFALAALTSLVPLGAGVYSLDAPIAAGGPGDVDPDGSIRAAPLLRASDAPAGTAPAGATGGDLFGSNWQPEGRGPEEPARPRRTGPVRADAPTPPADSLGSAGREAVGALPNDTDAPRPRGLDA
jgi:hypothetical protein